MNIGRKIYFDKLTGNVIQNTGERSGDVIETTIDQDFQSYLSLQGIVRDSVGVIQLNYGEYEQDFRECNGYRVNPTTLVLEFSYPDPNNPTQEIVYQKPLTEQLQETNTQLAQTNADIQGLMDYLGQQGVI